MKRRVPRPRSVRAGLGLGVGLGSVIGVLNAAWAETLLRQRRFAFYDVQLLSQIAASRNEAGTGCVRAEVDEGGYVVMPNHVHLLMCEPAKGTPSIVLHLLKQRVSRRMRGRKKTVDRKQLELAFGEDAVELPAFWQERFYDFNVYRDGKVKEKLNYMHANPVIRGLVKHPKDWPWSSWGHWAKGERGLVEIDAWRN